MGEIIKTIKYENGIKLLWGITEKNRLVFLYCGEKELTNEQIKKLTEERFAYEYSPVEIKVNGLDCPPGERFAGQMVHESLSELLVYKRHSIKENHEIIENSKVLENYETTGNLGELRNPRTTEIIFELETLDQKVEVTLNYVVYPQAFAVRCFNTIRNNGEDVIGVEGITSFSYCGLGHDNVTPYRNQLAINILHNGWQKELQWQRYSPEELGLALSQPGRVMNSSKTITFGNVGNWSTKNFIPCVYLEKLIDNEYLGIQIENNGSWNWQIGEHMGHLYFKAAGPTETFGSWYKKLAKGEQFTTVPVGVVVSDQSVEGVAQNMNVYRRLIRRENDDDRKLPVIFNDYMNCLWGDPHTENELPLIDAAAECGCEVYCIDCGWYDEGPWWDGVGEWQPSEKRFSGGFQNLLDYIKEKGMIPGLWLELEVVGINSPLLKRVPKDWFFMRHGDSIREKSRYQLDFRNPEVIDYVTEVIDRLVGEYGVGYIKMDYNIDAGIGTEYMADSAGDGLLEHNRAYLKWLRGIFAKYPDLIIENCSSGGLRMDYAMLSTYSIQSTSDMEDYRTYATISANAPLALCPEQAAIWSYPLFEGNEEETIYNMVNSILLRIHQSGHLAKLSSSRKALVKEGISFYKEIRSDRVVAQPFWPLGFATYESPWVSLGLTGLEKTYVAVWRKGSAKAEMDIPLKQFQGKKVNVKIAYPSEKSYLEKSDYKWDADEACLRVNFKEDYIARIFVIEQ